MKLSRDIEYQQTNRKTTDLPRKSHKILPCQFLSLTLLRLLLVQAQPFSITSSLVLYFT